MPQRNPVPAELTERLRKAEWHINAVERRLWKEVDRGLWSGHQAVARIAEAWFLFQGLLDSLPTLEKSLRSELLQERLDALEAAAPGTPLAARLQEIAAAEAAILVEPFPNLPNENRADLEAGVARKHRYLHALRGLVQEVEDAIADRYVPLRVGDWANVPRAGIGQLLDRPGLTGWFFVPVIGLIAPDEAIKGYSLIVHHLEPLSLGDDRPVGPPAYYWLLAANERWRVVEPMAEGDWVTISDFYRDFGAMLDAAAKAWLIGIAPLPKGVMWSQVYAQRHVPLLTGKAPPAIANPLVEALQRGETLFLRSIKDRGRKLPGSQEEISDILRLARRSLSAIQDALQAQVDLAEGQWLEVEDHGIGRIARRDGQRLLVDLGCRGVRLFALFETPIQRVSLPAE